MPAQPTALPESPAQPRTAHAPEPAPSGMTGTADTTDTVLTVVRGRPDDLELAAVTAVLGAMAQQADTVAPPTAPGPGGVRWGGDGRTCPAGSWRRGAGRHRPGPAGRARGMP